MVNHKHLAHLLRIPNRHILFWSLSWEKFPYFISEVTACGHWSAHQEQTQQTYTNSLFLEESTSNTSNIFSYLQTALGTEGCVLNRAHRPLTLATALNCSMSSLAFSVLSARRCMYFWALVLSIPSGSSWKQVSICLSWVYVWQYIPLWGRANNPSQSFENLNLENGWL